MSWWELFTGAVNLKIAVWCTRCAVPLRSSRRR